MFGFVQDSQIWNYLCEGVKPLCEKEILNAKNVFIHYFSVPQKYYFKEAQKDVEAGYLQKADPENVLNFFAVAYFFANELYQKYHLPIGLIKANLGCSPAKALISEEAFKKFPNYCQEAQQFNDLELIKKIENQDNARINC